MASLGSWALETKLLEASDNHHNNLHYSSAFNPFPELHIHIDDVFTFPSSLRAPRKTFTLGKSQDGYRLWILKKQLNSINKYDRQYTTNKSTVKF